MLASMALEIVLLLVLLLYSREHVRRSFPGCDPEGSAPASECLARLPQGRPHCAPDRELAGNGGRAYLSAQPALPQL